MIFSNEKYKVVKVFNNNVLLATLNGKEKILYGKGLGFGKTANEFIPANMLIEKVYTIENEASSNQFSQLINYVDSKIVGLCEEVIYMIGQELNEELNENIHISLTDHIAFTLKRLKENDEIMNPFLVETETLYKHEFGIARKATRLLESRLNIVIPDGEIGFITLHIHSARNNGKLSNTIKYTRLVSSMADCMEASLGLSIDRKSIDYARFVIHMRFAIERLQKGNPIKNELLSIIKKQFANSYKVSEKLAKLIEESLNVNVVEDEIAYLTVHVEKLKNQSLVVDLFS
ncbi:PRD domain-containing protein [Anoxybacterium hadale]|uniref:PRD domain-containing protein n=1 Tax=Anoxybacterium hadale TaxID=3408580 RepID=A0ACD1A616_9FIRM|nr:PRD domain-containing protein [Clostridiales bacterium]